MLIPHARFVFHQDIPFLQVCILLATGLLIMEVFYVQIYQPITIILILPDMKLHFRAKHILLVLISYMVSLSD